METDPAIPTVQNIQDIKSWDETRLPNWIQKTLRVPLKADGFAKFLDARITGSEFLFAAKSRHGFRESNE
jgi:hypothetical protein